MKASGISIYDLNDALTRVRHLPDRVGMGDLQDQIVAAFVACGLNF
jgi:hypothetical protein